jgi:hypothetical protein
MPVFLASLAITSALVILLVILGLIYHINLPY